MFDKNITRIDREVSYMGIILGFLCLFCFCLLITKALTRKLHLKKLDKFLMKAHKPVCAAFIIICILHIIFVLPVLKTRHMYVFLTGIATVVVMILLIVLCHIIKQDRSLKIRWHRILSAVMLLCIIGHIVIYYVDFMNYQTKIKDIQISEINLSNIKDGKYIGEYDAGYIYAKVEVSIKDGQIDNINLLEHHNERGTPAEKIIDEIIIKQQINVDTVSGATNSSMVIEKAVENALENASTTIQ